MKIIKSEVLVVSVPHLPLTPLLEFFLHTAVLLVSLFPGLLRRDIWLRVDSGRQFPNLAQILSFFVYDYPLLIRRQYLRFLKQVVGALWLQILVFYRL